MNVKLFYFDAKSDYLPYYKDFFDVKVDFNSSISTLLQKFDYEVPYSDFSLKINGIFTLSSTILKDIVTGEDILIEPITTKRATTNLIIDDDDFISRFEILKEYCNEQDFEYYKKFRCIFYASEMLKYCDEYLGDSFFVFVSYLIEKYPQHKENLLNIIDNKDIGIHIWEESINKTYPNISANTTIKNLKQMVNK